MENKVFNFMIVSLFLFILTISFSSALLTLTPLSIPSTALHGSTINIEIQLNSSENYTSLNWSQSDFAFNISALPSQIMQGQKLNLIIPFSIPKYQSPGNFSKILKVKDNNKTDEASLTITTKINESKELSVSDAQFTDNSTIINIKNEGNVQLTGIILSQSQGDFEVNFSENNFNLSPGQDKNISVSIVSIKEDLVGESTLIITAKSGDTTATGAITKETNFCQGIPLVERLEIRDVEITNKGFSINRFGEDDEWYPLEKIEVSLTLRNRANHDIRDVSLEWGLYNKELKEWVIEPTEEDEFDLDADDEMDVSFDFDLDNKMDIDLEDLTDGKDYVLYIRATGIIDEGKNEGNYTCDFDSQEASINIERNLVILDDFQENYSAFCSENLNIPVKVWNIGSRTQKDFSVTLYNSQLNINKDLTIDELKSFRGKEVSFDISIPEDATPGEYWLKLKVIDDDGIVYSDEDDEDSFFPVKLIIQGNCKVHTNLNIVAQAENLEEGQEGIVNVVITNLGSKTQIFNLSLSNPSWVESFSFNTSSLIIRAGESKQIQINLKPKQDSAGTHVLDLIFSSEKGIETQPIEVEVLKRSSFTHFFNKISGFSIAGNTYTASLSVLIIVLIIIIILLLIIRKLRK